MAPLSAQEMLKAVKAASKQQAKTGSGGAARNDVMRAAMLSVGMKKSGDKTAGSRNALDSRIASILNSDAPDEVKQSALKLASTNKASESWWEKTLNIVGKPKTVAVAGVSRLIDPKRNFAADVRKNVGVADVLGGSVGFQILPDVAKFGIGLGGDIALDPLTYLTGGSAAVAVGGSRGAAKIAFNAAQAARAAGKIDDAARFESLGQKAYKGLSNLNRAEKAEMEGLAFAANKIEKGQRLGGLYFTVPGTGDFLGIAEKPLQFKIPGSDALRIVPKGIRTTEETARASGLGKKTAEKLGGDPVKSAFISKIRRGTPEESRQAFVALDGWNLAEARSASYLRQLDANRQRIVNVAKASNVRMEDISYALNGDLKAAERVNAAVKRNMNIENFMDDVRAFDDSVIDEAHRLAGNDFVPKMQNHTPSLAGPGVSGGTPVRGRKNIFEPAGFESRANRAGDSFEGQILLEPNGQTYLEIIDVDDAGRLTTRGLSKDEFATAQAEGRQVMELGPDPMGRGVKQQREQIAAATYGADYQKMYNLNWDEASKAQVGGMARRLKGEIIKNHLRSNGIARDLYEEVATTAAQAAKEQIPEIRQRLKFLNINQRIAERVVENSPKRVRDAQENLAYAYKEAVDNAEYAATVAREAGEQYGVLSDELSKLVDAATSATRSADDARNFRDLLGTLDEVLDPSTSAYSFIRDIYQRSLKNAITASGKAEDDLILLTRVRQNMADELDSLNTALRQNEIDALRLQELTRRKAEIAGAIQEDTMRSMLPGVTKEVGSGAPKGVVRGESRSLPLGGEAERLALSPTENVVAAYDEAASVAVSGSRGEVREAMSSLNESLRAAGLPTVAVRGSVDDMLDSAQRILREADLVEGTRQVPLASVNRKASRAELQRIDDELLEIASRTPDRSFEELSALRDEVQKLYDDFDVKANNAGTRAIDARRLEDENIRRLLELQDQERTYRTNLELERRQRASQLRQEADELDSVERRRQRLNVKFADNEAMAAEQQAAEAIDRAAAAVARAEATAAQAEADLLRIGRTKQRLEERLGQLATRENETRFLESLQQGYAKLDLRTQAPEHIVEAATVMARLSEPGEMMGVLRLFDSMTNLFKTWAILTPGFHVRNFIGGVFNNYLAGMTVTSYKQFMRADRIFLDAMESGATRDAAFAAIGNAMGGDAQRAYRIVESSGAFRTPGQIGSASAEMNVGFANRRGLRGVLDTIKAKGSRTSKVDAITDNPLTRLNYKASERVERTLRGSLAYDVALKGGDEFAVLDNVYKFHFNYDDLSSFERTYMKRFSPFYTWSRKNVPLQFEMLLQNPSAYARIGYLQDNIEGLSMEETLVPFWYGQAGAIRLPFTNPGGEQLYAMPDLPPLDLKKIINPKDFLSEINPVIKVPFEVLFNKQVYNQQPFREGYVPFPKAWEKLGIGWVTDATGISRKDKDGNRVARDSRLYALESYLPMLGRVRRMFPSEDKYTRRAVATWASMVFGITIRANTEADVQGEIIRRSKKLESTNIDYGSLGYGGFKTFSKDIAVSSKPEKGERSPYLMVVEPKGGLLPSSPYTMPTRGMDGGQTLNRALSQTSRRNISPELQSLIERVQAGRRK
jgi:hypothetical protein